VHNEGGELIVYRSGNTVLNVTARNSPAPTRPPPSPGRSATSSTRSCGQLKERGVRFEHYDMPGLRLEGDIHIADDMKVAWFKDPDGNILNVVSG